MLASATSGSAARKPLRELAAASGIRIGTALDPALVDSASAYGALVATQFDSVTPENAMKWDQIAPTRSCYVWDAADRVITFAQAHHQHIRGHALVYYDQNPDWLNGAPATPSRTRKALQDHIATVVGRYAGLIDSWDVVNEPFAEDGEYRWSPWYEAFGPEYVAEALTCARSADPAAKMYINELDAEGFGPKSDALYALARDLKQHGVPLDGIGFQCHLALGWVPPRMQDNLQRFADLDLDIAITELDIRMDLPATESKLQEQARQYDDVIRICLGVDRIQGVTLWGCTDAASWIPARYPGWGAATAYDANYRPKPAYHAIAAALSGDTPAEQPAARQGKPALREVGDIATAAPSEWRYVEFPKDARTLKPPSESLDDDMLDTLRNSRRHLGAHYRSMNAAAWNYRYLYAPALAHAEVSFRCETPDTLLVGDCGVFVVGGRDLLTQSWNDPSAGLEPYVAWHYRPNDAARLAGTFVSLMGARTENYAHWLLDTLPRLMLLDPEEKSCKVIVGGPERGFHQQSLTLLGVPPERVVRTSGDGRWVEKAVLCHPARCLCDYPKTHLLELRRRMLRSAGAPGAASAASRRIYISRRYGSRRVANESELLPVLRHHGFDVMHCEELGLAAQIKQFATAEVILGAHGAGMANQLFAPPGAIVIEIFSRNYWEPQYAWLGAALGHRHWHTFGAPSGTAGDTTVEVGTLDRLLDTALGNRDPG